MDNIGQQQPARGGNIFGHRNRRSHLPNPWQLKHLPLHVKQVTAIDLAYVCSIMTESASKRLNDLMHEMRFNPAIPAVVPSTAFQVPDEHASAMTAAGIAKDIGSSDDVDLSQFNLLKYFTVVETRDQRDRLRPIMWPDLMNLLSQYTSQHTLKSVQQYRRLALAGVLGGISFDLAASFHQIIIEAISRMIMITESGRVIQMLRMPYGLDIASEIMHMVVAALAGDPRYAKPIPGVSASYFDSCCAVHIDNVFFGGPKAQQLADRFLDHCRRANVQLNVEAGNKLSTTQKFVGLALDMEHNTVALKPGYAADLSLDAVRTHEDLERAMGKLLYAGAVLGVDWSRYLFLIKQYRRILSHCGKFPKLWTSDIRLWTPARKEFAELLAVVHANVPVTVHPGIAASPEAPHAIIASDATPNTFGGLLLVPGHLPVAFGGYFPRTLDINLAESAAAHCMLSRFAEDIAALRIEPDASGDSRPRVLILVDNTTARQRVRIAIRGGGISEDGIAYGIRSIAEQHGLALSVRYIASALNPADAVSRMRDVDPALVQRVVDEAWGRHQTRIEHVRGRTCGRHAALATAP